MKGFCVQLQPASGEASRHSFISNCSKVDGSYLLNDMPPGRYVITAEPWANGKRQEPKIFYPGVVDRKNAQAIAIGSSEHLAGFEIRIPTRFETS